MYVCRSPQKGALLHTYGVQPGSPRGLLQHCCLYPSVMQPLAQYLPPWLG
jgi:hypothetical protein